MDDQELIHQLQPLGDVPTAIKEVAETPTSTILSARGPHGKLYEPAVEKKFLSALRVGAPIEVACGWVGVAPSSFYDRRTNDQDFADAVITAQSSFIIRNLQKMAEASDWKAAQAALQTVLPQLYGKDARGIKSADKVRVRIEMADAPVIDVIEDKK